MGAQRAGPRLGRQRRRFHRRQRAGQRVRAEFQPGGRVPVVAAGKVVAEQHRAQVRVGVHPIAVGMVRIVVQVLGVAGHHPLEEARDVGEQRDLVFVDEQGAGGVHRPDADQPFADIALAHELHHPIGQIDHFDTLIGLDDERLAVNRQAAGIRGGHAGNGLLANGDGGALAHALAFCGPER